MAEGRLLGEPQGYGIGLLDQGGHEPKDLAFDDTEAASQPHGRLLSDPEVPMNRTRKPRILFKL